MTPDLPETIDLFPFDSSPTALAALSQAAKYHLAMAQNNDWPLWQRALLAESANAVLELLRERERLAAEVARLKAILEWVPVADRIHAEDDARHYGAIA